MANALDMVAGVGQFGFDPLGDFVEGRKARNYLDELKRTDKARTLTGSALQGDKNALRELPGVDPGAFMEVSKYQRSDPSSEADKIASLVNWADTPEKWAQATQRIQASGHQLSPEELDFNNRGAMLAEYTTLKEQRAQANADRLFNADQAYKDKYLGILQQKADQVGTGSSQRPPTGYRQSATGDLEAIPGGPADPKVKAALKSGGPMTASMLKLKRETENSIVDLENTKAVLSRAKELAPQTFEGFGAGARASIGTKAPFLPGANIVAEPGGAMATAEFGNIMSMEAIQSMSNSLKGATTDFELRKFEAILSDPSTPAKLKLATINRMLALADNQLALEQQRLEEFGSEMPDAGSGDLQPGAEEDGYRFLGGDKADPNNWEPIQ